MLRDRFLVHPCMLGMCLSSTPTVLPAVFIGKFSGCGGILGLPLGRQMVFL